MSGEGEEPHGINNREEESGGVLEELPLKSLLRGGGGQTVWALSSGHVFAESALLKRLIGTEGFPCC